MGEPKMDGLYSSSSNSILIMGEGAVSLQIRANQIRADKVLD